MSIKRRHQGGFESGFEHKLEWDYFHVSIAVIRMTVAECFFFQLSYPNHC